MVITQPLQQQQQQQQQQRGALIVSLPQLNGGGGYYYYNRQQQQQQQQRWWWWWLRWFPSKVRRIVNIVLVRCTRRQRQQQQRQQQQQCQLKVLLVIVLICVIRFVQKNRMLNQSMVTHPRIFISNQAQTPYYDDSYYYYGSSSSSSVLHSEMSQSFSSSSSSLPPFLVGKSCTYNPKGIFTFWDCQECNEDGECHSITHQRRYKCNFFRRLDWDHPIPRAQSQFNNNHDATATATTNAKLLSLPFQSWNFYARYTYTSQPMCTMESCWDLTRCQEFIDHNILTVYLNETAAHANLQYAQQQNANNNYLTILQVQDPTQACLILVRPTTYASHQEMINSKHWNIPVGGGGNNNGNKDNNTNNNTTTTSSSSIIMPGQNHLIWNLEHHHHRKDEYWYVNNDAPFQMFHYGYAAVAAETLTTTYIRWGYDIPLALPCAWGRKASSSLKDDFNYTQYPQKWLLSFRGRIKDKWRPYYQHRWLAAEYWNTTTDHPNNNNIFVDVMCLHVASLFPQQRRHAKPYDYSDMEDDSSSNNNNSSSSSSSTTTIYDSILTQSTFGFAPGGGGPSSFRFTEYLSTGTIPVVVQGDFVPPLAPELDWSKCIVYVPESRIIDLPNILQNMLDDDNIQQRQKHCWHLYQILFGGNHYEIRKHNRHQGVWVGDIRVQFTKALEIMAARIKNAFEKQKYQNEMLQHYFSTNNNDTTTTDTDTDTTNNQTAEHNKSHSSNAVVG